MQLLTISKGITAAGSRGISLNVVVCGQVIIPPEEANHIPLSKKGVPPAEFQAKLDI